jgi:hypothetical protein
MSLYLVDIGSLDVVSLDEFLKDFKQMKTSLFLQTKIFILTLSKLMFFSK